MHIWLRGERAQELLACLQEMHPEQFQTGLVQVLGEECCVQETDWVVVIGGGPLNHSKSIAFPAELGKSVQKVACALLACICQVNSQTSPSLPCSLLEVSPFLPSTNIRKRLPMGDLSIKEGLGQEGDLIIGTVWPKEKSLCVYDHERRRYSFSEPTLVMGVLGNRESSTHCNGGVPQGGLPVTQGLPLHWIALESAIVGVLFHESTSNQALAVERSIGFTALGLLYHKDTTVFNIRELAVNPSPTLQLTTPVIMVAATSAESGKTVLTGKLISRLSQSLRVAAIKTTGTGSIEDSLVHRQAGASLTYDQVDAGLITTYTHPSLFSAQIPRVFLQAQQDKADVIVAELGGDIVWANNPALLEIPAIKNNLVRLYVISNDAFSCLGVNGYLQDRVTAEKLCHVASPFRNYFGLLKRMAVFRIAPLLDSNDPSALDNQVSQINALIIK